MERKSIAIISIPSVYADEIFNEERYYDFRKSKLDDDLLNEKIYVYSARRERAIVGYIRVDDIINGSTLSIIKQAGYDPSSFDGRMLKKYFGRNNQNCYALHLYDATEFEEHLKLDDIRTIDDKVKMPNYIDRIYEDNPLYNLIKEWDKTFSLDGSGYCKNIQEEKNKILKKRF